MHTVVESAIICPECKLPFGRLTFDCGTSESVIDCEKCTFYWDKTSRASLPAYQMAAAVFSREELNKIYLKDSLQDLVDALYELHVEPQSEMAKHRVTSAAYSIVFSIRPLDQDYDKIGQAYIDKCQQFNSLPKSGTKI